MRRGALCMLILLSIGAAASQPQRATLTTALNYDALQPGQQAVAAIVVNIKPGFHTQSHTPTKPTFIKFNVTLNENPHLKIFEPIYPVGEDHEYPALGKLNVYTGRVIVYVPIEAKKDAPPDSLTIEGKITYQICDKNACYMPESPTFLIATKIVEPGVVVSPANAELFRDFDLRVFAESSAAKPRAAVKRQEFDLFGWHFSIASNAYGLAMALAFFVGIIFNLMPCVLPVLPLKAVGFFEVAQHNRAKSLLLGTIFSIGLVASFGVLALLVLVFRSLTWGEQFSNPWFVGVIVTILVLMALGMFGAFTFLLPTAVYRFTPRHDTYTGNFLFGIFTAVLSTPCTAPMFVALLVWAGQQPKSLGVATVMMVGVGMAFPYFLLSAFPELARRFPRTGPWAELIKQMMGFLLLAVAVYFAGGSLIHGRAFLWAVLAVIIAAGMFLVVRTLHFTRRPVPIIAAVILALLLIVGGSFATIRVAGSIAGNEKQLIAWREYSEQALADARRAGKIVMVEFTANWCANCLTLEGTVFQDPDAASAIHTGDVVTLRADLTSSSTPGWKLLRELNPAGGIPLTAIYSPGRDEPIQLSSIYSTQNLVDALKQAGEKVAAAR